MTLQMTQLTAAAEYKRRRQTIADLLQEINEALDFHEEDWATSGRTGWAYPNELGHVEESLREIVNFLINEE